MKLHRRCRPPTAVSTPLAELLQLQLPVRARARSWTRILTLPSPRLAPGHASGYKPAVAACPKALQSNYNRIEGQSFIKQDARQQL